MESLSKSNTLDTYHGIVGKLVDQIEQVIRGKRSFLKLLMTSLISGGHVLLEDVPGLGKTTAAKTVARLIEAEEGDSLEPFSRIQFTPDLLPYDITGVDVFDPEKKAFIFTPGPIFAHIVLADEINRTTPKVQSALLEVMAEQQVTVGNNTHSLPGYFFVIATQNPVEIEGTYPLPLAQLDRFFMKLSLGYPDPEVELEIVRDEPADNIMPDLKPVVTQEELLELQAHARTVFCDEKIMRAAVAISEHTRRHHHVAFGVSPRGSQMLIRACRSWALVNGRDYVIDQDLVDLAPWVLSHRLELKDGSVDPSELIREVTLEEVANIPY